MGKYEPLEEFLGTQTRDRIPMTFSEIERILKSKLPVSKKHRAWWSNNPDNNVMTRAWLAAGYETEAVDIASGKLVFRRVKKMESAVRPTIFGCMKGLFTLAEDYDPTAPTGDDWEAGALGDGRK
jgi:hypothetical protein